MQWIMLFLAGISEIIWALFMKLSDGFTRPVPSAVTVFFYIASALLLSAAMKKLPVGTAYSMWTGFGIIGTTLCGVFLFRETLTVSQIFCIIMIICGIIGLRS